MNFQKIVVVTAIVILIGLLTWIGYTMYNNEYNVKFPPVSSECPDYWTSKNNLCYNDKDLGNCNTGKNNMMNFNTAFFKGDQGICRKARWARRCGVTWNGVTNAGSQIQEKCS